LLLVLIGGVIGYVIYDQQRRWTPEQVEQAVNDSLPPGSTRAQIVAFLDAKGFPRRFYLSYRDVSAHQAGVAEADFGEAIVASVPDPGLGLLTGGWIHVTFYLDKSGRLIKFQMDVQRFYL
jgi:hypothetical protein